MSDDKEMEGNKDLSGVSEDDEMEVDAVDELDELD